MRRGIIGLLIVLLIILQAMPLSVYGAAYNRSGYGRLAADQATFEGLLRRNAALHNSVGYTIGETTQEHWRGKQSMRVDYQSAVGAAAITLEHGTKYTNIPIEGDMREGVLLLRYYIKGVPANVSTIYPSVFFRDSANNELTTSQSKTFIREEKENGWSEYSLRLDLSKFSNNLAYVGFGINWNRPSDSDKSIGVFYIDDVTVIYLPKKLEVADAVWYNRTLPLDILNMKGIGASGATDRIMASDRIEYKVISGQAQIENRKLVYTGTGAGQVTLEADLYGVKDEFSIDFLNQALR